MIMALDKTNVWRVDTENNNFLVSPYSSGELTGQANLTPEEQQRLTELKANLGQFLS